ncbi:MAG TPA: hypothetical protein VF733_05820 [Candidatus Saccharimonadales bacterium]
MFSYNTSHLTRFPEEYFGVSNAGIRETFGLLSDDIAAGHQDFANFHNRHLTKSKKVIWAAAQLALERAPADSPKRALILGAGSCEDIPLQKIAENFDETMVLDIDTRHVWQAIRFVPPRLWPKITIVAKDLTGMLDAFGDRLDAIPSGYTLEQFVNAAAQGFTAPEAANSVVPPDNDFTLTVSHLLHDQLSSSIHQVVRRKAYLQYGTDIGYTSSEVSEGYNDAYDVLADNLSSAHRDYLAASIGRTGVVHFGGTYDYRKFARPSPDAEEPLEECVLSALSQLGDATYWNWRQNSDQIYSVAAYTLQLTPESE